HPPDATAGTQRGYPGPDQPFPFARWWKLYGDGGSDGGHALLRLAGKRPRTRELHPAHGRRQFGTPSSRGGPAVKPAKPHHSEKVPISDGCGSLSIRNS